MTMTPEEIVRHWQQAKRQNANELQLLAELNSTDKDTIRKVLENAGEPLPKQRSKLRGEELKKAIEELYDQRLSDAEIARRVGCTNTTVAAWQVETLLAALPEGCSRMVRSQARDLCSVLLSEYLEERLKLKEETA